MIGLNLLPDVKKEFIKAQRTRNTVIGISILGMLIAGGITAFLALYVYVGQFAAISLVKSSINEKQKTLEGKTEIGKYLTIQNQLDSLAVLHNGDNKALYSRLFDYLVKLNPAQPNQISLGASHVVKDKKLLSFDGFTKDFQSLDIFKNTLENAKIGYKLGDKREETKLFSDVKLVSAALSQDSAKPGVSFSFELTYDQVIFRPDISEIEVVIPKLVISDSQTNAPSELFNGTPGGAN